MSMTLDDLTISEMTALSTLGFIAITSNGHLIAVCEEDKAERFERERTEKGL